ncbi:putative C6 transcription factor [Aspergillus saccharolyticus JOP 1030-1]|uniref:C6 zinc finger domain protein n=1 Tax=Aspergillus saccharolyticus JOP 1030-1 TaxID=1450539 RepID=A0A318Z371_9EURO|nr:C6 zinc finger domain protein [Aspergillus saccharolyticus JOP 1030-1]PYH41526.1 C6 zinc finger domain protein [Aspergillus saccharolyticus JOP 1030-1]
MDSDDSCVMQVAIGKKRIPKACSACRHSKVRCDGKRPCSRCKRSRKQCVFYEVPKDPATERLQNVESEVQRLRSQIEGMNELLHLHSQRLQHEGLGEVHTDDEILDRSYPVETSFPGPGPAIPNPGHMPMLLATTTSSAGYPQATSASLHIPSPIDTEAQPPCRQRRSGFDVREDPISDFICKGLMTADQAISCFRTFFEGCDRYIPIFDPDVDTFTSVRSRSSMLFNAICTIGSRVEASALVGFDPQLPDFLHAELKKWIGVVIQNRKLTCLESVQALLIVACYTAERSLILSFATRMALDLGLNEAFEKLIQRLTLKRTDSTAEMPDDAMDAQERYLMRKSRTWFGLLVLDHIFHVDGGKPPGIRMKGNARRCRILLHHPASTVLDMRLFSQVELNVIRANINDTLDVRDSLAREAIAEYVHEAKVDLDLWFDDWQRIIVNSLPAQEERPFLLAALSVQHCWAELILHCKALRSMGVENVAAITPVERNILHLAKSAARQHLRLISLEPAFYLAKLKYAMDFVWAKCAFCFLLLLKLSRLLPEQRDEHQELLELGTKLLAEMASGASATRPEPRSGNIYMHILHLSIEKYSRIFQERRPGKSIPTNHHPHFWDLFDAQVDLQSFVPEQFVRDWDFPGLNLFYFPTAWQDFFGDFSLGFGS